MKDFERPFSFGDLKGSFLVSFPDVTTVSQRSGRPFLSLVGRDVLKSEVKGKAVERQEGFVFLGQVMVCGRYRLSDYADFVRRRILVASYFQLIPSMMDDSLLSVFEGEIDGIFNWLVMNSVEDLTGSSAVHYLRNFMEDPVALSKEYRPGIGRSLHFDSKIPSLEEYLEPF
jgi:hypothetical protein